VEDLIYKTEANLHSHNEECSKAQHTWDAEKQYEDLVSGLHKEAMKLTSRKRIYDEHICCRFKGNTERIESGNPNRE
jgi:hypothetical protein